MSWKYIVLSVVVMVMVCAGKDPAVKDLAITSINLDVGDDTILVCFTVKKDDAPSGTEFVLNIGTDTNPSKDKEYIMVEDSYTEPDKDNAEVCASFTGPFAPTPNPSTKIYFILEGTHTKKDDIVVKGIESITLKDIPTSATAQWVGKKAFKKKHGSSLRIAESLDGWKVCNNEANQPKEPTELTCKAPDKPCYVVNIGAETADTLSICETNDKGIPFLVKIISFTDASGPGPTPTAILLDYKSKTLTLTDVVVGTSEAVIYKENEKKGFICTAADVCAFTDSDYNPSATLLNILLITVADNVATGSTEKQFQDSNLKLLKFDETVFESKWTQYENTYLAERSGVPEDSSYQQVDVDCTANNGFCYAYFVNIATNNKYTVTTKPGDHTLPNVMNAITSNELQMTPNLDMKNLMKNVNIEKQFEKDYSSLKLNTCFNTDSTNDLNNTQLEVVLISANRQWKRILEEIMYQDEEQLCYSTTFALNSDTDAHSLLTALVIQRDVKSDDVLSFYRSDINLSGQNVNQPDEDKSSEGAGTLAIVGAAIAGVACIMALAAAAVLFVMKRRRNNDGLQYPLHRNTIENSNTIYGLNNLNSTY